jgi:hypothetical protein
MKDELQRKKKVFDKNNFSCLVSTTANEQEVPQP